MLKGIKFVKQQIDFIVQVPGENRTTI